MNALRRKIEILDFGTPTPPPDRDVSADFSRGYKWNMAEHPTTIAMVAAAREQAARLPYEQSAAFQAQHARLSALLADVPKATKAAYNQARARFTEVEHVLTEAEAEQSRVNADRPMEISKIDRWANEFATAERRVQALTAAHSQAVAVLHDARSAVLAALQDGARKRAATRHSATETAQRALQQAQSALQAACQAEQDAQQIYARVRDSGLKDQHVAMLLKGDL